MTNTDITKIKQQIGADNFNILFTKAGFENQFMEEYKNVYKQLEYGNVEGGGFKTMAFSILTFTCSNSWSLGSRIC